MEQSGTEGCVEYVLLLPPEGSEVIIWLVKTSLLDGCSLWCQAWKYCELFPGWVHAECCITMGLRNWQTQQRWVLQSYIYSVLSFAADCPEPELGSTSETQTAAKPASSHVNETKQNHRNQKRNLRSKLRGHRTQCVVSCELTVSTFFCTNLNQLMKRTAMTIAVTMNTKTGVARFI